MIGAIDQSHREALPGFKMQRDVAAVVDVGALEFCGARHGAEYFFGDGAGHCCHRGDEMLLGIGLDRRKHASLFLRPE